MFFENFQFPFDALRPRGGPYFLLLQKVGKDRRKGVSPPCESPDQSGVLDAPLWKPPSLAALSGLAELLAASRLELRCRWGRPRAPARSPRPPHLHRFGVGAAPPGPLPFPLGDVCPSCAFVPHVPRWGTSADHARTRMGPRSTRLLQQRLRKSPGSSCRAAARSSVTPLARIAAEGRASATAEGESQRGRSPLWPVFAYFLLARK